MKRIVTLFAVAAFGFVGVGESMAATTGADLYLSTAVTSNCSVKPTSVAFGSSDGLAALKAQGGVSVTCAKGVNYAISLGKGNYHSGTSRQFSDNYGGKARIPYNLYQDAAQTTPWGDGTTGGATLADVGTGAAQAHVVYGVIPAFGTGKTITRYGDSVAISVIY